MDAKPVSSKINALKFLSKDFQELPNEELELFLRFLNAYRGAPPLTVQHTSIIIDQIYRLRDLKTSYEGFTEKEPPKKVVQEVEKATKEGDRVAQKQKPPQPAKPTKTTKSKRPLPTLKSSSLTSTSDPFNEDFGDDPNKTSS